MTTCRCCGQIISAPAVRSASPSTIWVDAAVLDCCNRAYALAEQDGVADVEVAHLVHVIASHGRHRTVLEPFDLDALLLAVAVREALMAMPLATHGDKPRTSRDLKMLIARARQDADRQRAETVTLSHVLEVLLTGSADFACSRQVARWRHEGRRDRYIHTQVPGRASAAAYSERNRPQALDWRRERAEPQRFSDFGTPPPRLWETQHRQVRMNAPQRFVGTERARTDADILERLVRQEQMLASVNAQLAARDEAERNRAASQKSVRRKSAPTAAAEAQPAAMAVDELARVPPPPPPPAPARAPVPVSAIPRLQLRDRLRRGSWLRRHGAGETSHAGARQDLRTGPERSERGPLLSLVPTPAPARVPVSRVSPELIDDDDEVVALEDEASDELTENGERVKRFYLALDDEIVRAPSIGPKTAARIVQHGVVRVRDLLGTDARKLAARIGARHITAERITLWQDQARLVCTVPWLRGTHAQILVGAGFTTVKKILAAEPIVVCAAIRIFATTREGQSVLRSGPPPDDARVFRWVAHALVAEVDRAA